ncbi:MAG: P-loop NTPase, partial [Planctomycetes bacterium]|nr:P-loop NTPase [Planctomycetota bacterium]
RLHEELQTKKELVPDYVTIERWASAPEGDRLPKKGEEQFYFVVLIALLTASGLVYLVDYLDTTVRTSTDVKKYLNLPLLSSVPRISDRSKLLSQIPLKSPLVEIFGRLATLILSMLERQAGKTLLLTSVTKREGKSTLSANLAIAIARIGRRVALLDCDMRRPVLHHYFSLDNSTGMSTYLEGKIEAREALAALREAKPPEPPAAEGLEILDEPPEIAPLPEGEGAGEAPAAGGVPHLEPGDLRAREAMGEAGEEAARAENVQALTPDVESILMPSGVANLWVVPSGPTPANPISLLESDRMDALLAVLRNSVDIIIIDSPPLDSTADPLTLSTRVDACILVTLSGEVRRHQVTWAKRMLQELEANIIGVVLNMCAIESKAYYYYYTRDPEKSFRDHE